MTLEAVVLWSASLPEDIRAGQNMHMGRLAQSTGTIKLVRGQVQGGSGVSMICSLYHSNMPSTWPVGSCYAECQIICL